MEGMAVPTSSSAPSSALGSAAAPTQQTRHARRIYVGGLEAVPEHEIAELFTAIIRATMLHPLPPDVSPVLSVYINPERKFAFVEVATIELATALQALDGLVRPSSAQHTARTEGGVVRAASPPDRPPSLPSLSPPPHTQTYKGQPLKIRRPHDYKPEILPMELREKAEPLNLALLGQVGLGGAGGGSGGGGGAGGGTGIGTTGNRDSLHRIFVGGLPTGVCAATPAFHAGVGCLAPPVDAPKTHSSPPPPSPAAVGEQQLAELMGAFGEIKHLHIVRGADGAHKGFGFCEYVDPAMTDLAVQSLHGMPIGDRSITVSRAKAGGAGGGGGAPTGANSTPMMDPAALAAMMGGGMAHGGAGMGGGIGGGEATRIVVLEHMVQVSELADDGEYADILADITEESGKHGAVQVTIPRPPAPGAGRVFLQFAAIGNADAAARDMHGRKFGPNTIVAKFYDEAAFGAGVMTA